MRLVSVTLILGLWLVVLGSQLALAQATPTPATPTPASPPPAPQAGQPKGQPAKAGEGAKEAGQPGRLVAVQHTGDDPVGLKLAFHLKERLAKSPLFRMAGKDDKRIVIRLTTRAEFPGRAHLAAVYSVAWVYAEKEEVLAYFLTQDVGLVDADKVVEEAEALTARTDKIAGQYGYLFE